MTFAKLELIDPLLKAVAEAGYQAPTPIQRDAIPPALAGRDLVACAQTGTGKTAAFALPILQRLEQQVGEYPELRALVLTPTRELAAQIGDSFTSYGKHLEQWHTVIFGGVSDKPQIAQLREGVDTLIATPGRLLDLIGQREVDLSRISIFVLDEADRMLDMGFLPDVRRVIAQLPEKRQTLLFSATFPDPIRELAKQMLHDAVEVSVARISEPADNVEQHVYFVDKADKRKLLIELLRQPSIRRALVFSRTKHGANRIAKTLDRASISAAAIHGNKSQGARTRALDGFKSGDVRVLVATDIAARGIDVESISHVINFDLPNVPETYVHRIGRTARAGASGIALSFCEVEERPYLADIERLIDHHVDRVEDHDYPPTEPLPPPTDLSPRSRRSASPSNARRGSRSGSRPRGESRPRGNNGQSLNGRGQRPAGPSSRRGRGGRGRRGGRRGGGGSDRGGSAS